MSFHGNARSFRWQIDMILAFSGRMNPPDERFAPLGTHLLCVDGDTLILIARGILTLSDMRELLDNFARTKREHGRLFVIYDGRECTGFDADARKVASSKRSDDIDADLRVAFGISFSIRVLLNMIVYAQKVLLHRNIAVPVFETENEAWAFFTKERERIRQEKGVKTSP